MSWLLDTDVICQPAKKKGDPKVVAGAGSELIGELARRTEVASV